MTYEETKANEKIIVFRHGEDNKTILETESYDSSLFYDQYEQALGIFRRLTIEKTDADGLYDNSNIIAFCGDRGEGKTSCLRTVRYLLTHQDALDSMSHGLSDYRELAEGVLALDILDPSYFDDTHNVIELVLGQMFELAAPSTGNPSIDINKRKSLMVEFQRTKACISALRMDMRERQYDEMEELTNLAASVRLRYAISNLFKSFLQYFGKDKLVICIDDLDMNMQYGYKMVEDIRKYLCVPQCVVLVAVKVDQLTRLIQMSIANTIHSQKEVNGMTLEQIDTMAQKYVAKFIPESHRVIMPSPESIAERQAILYLSDNTVFQDGNNTLKEIVVRLIFDRTRYLFYNGRTNSPIIPRNLRSVRQLIDMLVDMKPLPFDAPKQLEEVKEVNKKLFRNYFFQSWVRNLAAEDQAFALQLAKYEDIISINKFVVTHLWKRLRELGIEKVDGLFDDIVRADNRSHNISVGDVFYIIRQIEIISTDENISLLLFFVRSFYSMGLYGRYDELTTTESLQSAYKLRSVSLQTNNSTHTESVNIYKYDSLYEGTNMLQKFLNGSYFTYRQGSLINDRDIEKNSLDLHRDYKVVKGDQLEELLKSVIKENKKFDNTKGSVSKELEKRLHRCEYFILCNTFQLEGKPNLSEVGINRRAIDPPFIGQYDNIRKYLSFDFLAIFYNIVNPRYAYRRFGQLGEQLYTIALRYKGSLLNQMVFGDTKGMMNAESYHRLLSDAIIRVSEVQQAIVDELNKNRLTNIHKETGANTKKLSHAYKDIVNLQISLYPNTVNGKAYKLNFRFLNAIIQYLDQEKEDDFNAIYLLDNTISLQKKGIYAILPSLQSLKTFTRKDIITCLRADIPNLPTLEETEYWDTIFPESKYPNLTAVKRICTAHKKDFERYINKV